LPEVQEVCDKVAIIDRGTLLTYASVKNLAAAKGATVVVNSLNPISPGEYKAITGLKGVRSVKRTEARALVLQLDGGAREQFYALRGILNTGVKVTSFTPRRGMIEDVYLSLVPEEEF